MASRRAAAFVSSALGIWLYAIVSTLLSPTQLQISI